MSEGTKPVVEVGHVVKFKGYKLLEKGAEAILNEGELVKVTEIEVDGDDIIYTVRGLTAEGEADMSRKGEQLFDDEFEVVEQPVAEEAPVEVAQEPVEAVTDFGGIEPEVSVEAPEKAKAENKATTKGKGKPKAAAKSKKAESESASQGPETVAEPAEQVESQEPEISADSPGYGEGVLPAAAENAPTQEINLESNAFEHDPVVLEIIQNTNDITPAAHDLSAQHEEIYFKLGGLLAEMKRNELHVAAGYEDSADGFNKFASDRAGVGERKGYHLQRIYRTFRMAGISAADLAGIGWTKSRVLAKVKAEELARDRDILLETARNQTREDLEAHVKTTYENADSETDRVQKTVYKFTLYGDATSLVEQALDEAKGRVENADANAAFEMIMTEWLTSVQGQTEGAGNLVVLPRSREELEELARQAGYAIDVVGPADEDIARAGAEELDAVLASADGVSVEVSPEED